MQTECTKLIVIMNFSVLDFFKFASRMPQIAQVKLVSTFKIFSVGGEGGGGGRRKRWGGGGGHAPDTPHRNFLFFFFISNSTLCHLLKFVCSI